MAPRPTPRATASSAGRGLPTSRPGSTTAAVNTEEAKTLREQVSAFNATEREVQVKLITLPVGDYAQQVHGSPRRTAACRTSSTSTGPTSTTTPGRESSSRSTPASPSHCARTSCPRSSSRAPMRSRHVGHRDVRVGPWPVRAALDPESSRNPRPAGRATRGRPTSSRRVLQRLRQAGFERPLDLQLDEPNPEWYTYGFAPAVWSAGGDLIDRANYRKVDGFLNGPRAVKRSRSCSSGSRRATSTRTRNWRRVRGEAEARSRGSATGSTTGTRRRSRQTCRIVPLPNFGNGTATDSGSWQWGITSNATDGDAVWRFLEFLLTPAGGAPDDARQRRDSRHEERRAHLT